MLKLNIAVSESIYPYIWQTVCSHLLTLFADFSTMKMEAICSPKRRLTQDLHGILHDDIGFKF
jgi:hypothetical protein